MLILIYIIQVIVLAAIFAIGVVVIVAVPVPEETSYQRQEIRDEHGQFAFAFQGDGAAQTAHGALKPNSDGTGNVLVTKVSFFYSLLHK